MFSVIPCFRLYLLFVYVKRYEKFCRKIPVYDVRIANISNNIKTKNIFKLPKYSEQ